MKTYDLDRDPEKAFKDSNDNVIAPRFRKPLHNCHVFESEIVKLEVAVEGLPKPNVSWQFEGKSLVENENVFSENDGIFYRFVCGLIVF